MKFKAEVTVVHITPKSRVEEEIEIDLCLRCGYGVMTVTTTVYLGVHMIDQHVEKVPVALGR